ncbi:hypothetical protein BOX15_Mlig003310g1 [Macrostomum lignano]|uniref:Methyltransferase FkbM domain-containing protein n=1 Tax=Macrostomum lignano TaxID=282301 RepID=A0A267GVC0_9PLAT|nr:hypothetical protein BOX15_Mlig003310g1 [Macrostomum lignano]
MNLARQQRRRVLKDIITIILAMMLAIIIYKLLVSGSLMQICSKANNALVPDHGTVPATVDNPLPSGACGAYSELRNVNFLHKSISEGICEGAAAYTIVDSAFPLCRLKQHLPQVLIKGVKAGSREATLKSPVSQRSIPCFIYSCKDIISAAVYQSHIFEANSVLILQKIVKKFQEKSLVTFVDVGSNIGVFSLSVLDLGVPVIALDANIRNLIRIKLSAEAANSPHKLHLLWNFISTRVHFTYLNFPQQCNVGGATNFGGKSVVDTIPVMSATADSIVPLIDTKLVVLKVAIEGSEGEFFKSAQKLFDTFTIPVVHMKWLNWQMSEEERQFMISFFAERRYSPRSIKDASIVVANPGDRKFHCDRLLWIRDDYLGLVLESLK